MKIYQKISTLIALLFSQTAMSQMVQNKSFDVLLSTLLSHNVKEISANKAAELKDVIYLDAREYNEYLVSHIENAIWCGYNDFDFNRLNGVAKKTKIIVYCSVGYRSEKITEKLLLANYSNVSNMYGGIFEWINTGHKVVDAQNKVTNNVHAYSKTWGIWLSKGTKIY